MVAETGARHGDDVLVTLELDDHNLVTNLEHLIAGDILLALHHKAFFFIQINKCSMKSPHILFKMIIYSDKKDI